MIHRIFGHAGCWRGCCAWPSSGMPRLRNIRRCAQLIRLTLAICCCSQRSSCEFGGFDEANRDLASLRGHDWTDPFLVYLEALSKGMQGDKPAMSDGVSRALAMLPDRADDMDAILSNRALFLFVLGDSEQASQIVSDMISAKAIRATPLFHGPVSGRPLCGAPSAP